MFFVLSAVIGFLIGYRQGMTRTGYLMMALTGVVSSSAQIAHMLLAQSRESITMLPLVVGLILLLCMLFGALARLAFQHREAA